MSGLITRITAVALLIAGLAVFAAPGGVAFARRPAAVSGPAWPGNPFSPTSIWNAPLGANAPLAPQSQAYAQELIRQVNRYGPWLNTYQYSVPVYVVGARQPTVHVTLDAYGPDLQAEFNAVPLPSHAVPARGSDAELTVWQPSTNRMWDFYKLHRARHAWHASWGGFMSDASKNPGYFTHSGLTNNWGATATGLPLLGGLVTFADLKRGYINHALAIALVETAPRYFAWPAQRTDGGTFTRGITAIPEGTRFRLDPSLNIDSLHLPPLDRMLAQAAQRYGIVVRDKAGAVTFVGQAPTSANNPWTAVFGRQYVGNILHQFPWSHLEALQAPLSCCWSS
jgi:hypothetical protein